MSNNLGDPVNDYVILGEGNTSAKIDDDTFSLNKEWVLDFCDKYSKEFDMSFECNVRIGAVDRETLLAFKKAGCNPNPAVPTFWDRTKRQMGNSFGSWCSPGSRIGVGAYVETCVVQSHQIRNRREAIIETNYFC